MGMSIEHEKLEDYPAVVDRSSLSRRFARRLKPAHKQQFLPGDIAQGAASNCSSTLDPSCHKLHVPYITSLRYLAYKINYDLYIHNTVSWRSLADVKYGKYPCT